MESLEGNRKPTRKKKGKAVLGGLATIVLAGNAVEAAKKLAGAAQWVWHLVGS